MLVAVALAVTGYVATSQLRQYLIGQQQTQLQDQVRSLGERIANTIQLCNTDIRYPGPTLIACANDDTSAIVQGGAGTDRSPTSPGSRRPPSAPTTTHPSPCPRATARRPGC
ncbi:hypothetical protein ACFQX8_26295 [Klenkia terrae]|uniref:hypothetical protein n=1 Tax=Klenkia terrae TaxID=1052259 RepID=UPI00360E1641